MFIFGNLFAFGSALCLFLSSFKKEKEKIIKLQIVDCTFCIISDILLKGYMGALCTSVSLIRNILYYFKKMNTIISFLLIGIIVSLGCIFNTEGIYGIIPIIANVEYTIAICFTKSPILLKISLLVNCLLWFVYCIIIQAYPMIISNLVISISCLLNIIKDIKSKQNVTVRANSF